MSSRRNRLAASTVVIPCSRSSCGSRPCQVPKAALAAAPRLRRVGRDHLHSQLAQRPPHLRQPVRIDLAARLRGEPEMAAPIAVQSAEQPLRSITSRSPAITVFVDSSSTSWA